MALVPGRYMKSAIATTTTAANATADQSIEMVPPSSRDSDTRGLLRRIMRRVRDVMDEMVTDTSQIQRHRALGHPKSAATRVSLNPV